MTTEMENQKFLSKADRVLLTAFTEISQMAARMNVPINIVNRASHLFKMMRDGKKLQGRPFKAQAGACLYIACRRNGTPRTFNEICSVSNVSKKDISRCFRHVLKSLDIYVETITAGDLTTRFCSRLSLPDAVENVATAIAKVADKVCVGLEGRCPITVAAASIYLAAQASGVNKSQQEIGDIAGVRECTISQVYKQLRERANRLFPKDFQFIVPIRDLPKA